MEESKHDKVIYKNKKVEQQPQRKKRVIEPKEYDVHLLMYYKNPFEKRQKGYKYKKRMVLIMHKLIENSHFQFLRTLLHLHLINTYIAF
jgi:hypothetical protein